MRAALRGRTKNANFATDRTVERATGSGIRSAKSASAYQEEILRLIRTAWPECTAKFLAAAGDISQRQAERILARQKRVSYDLLWALMESEECGFRFYWAILDCLTTRWSQKERHDREGALIDNQMRTLTERKRIWQERTA